jgi:GMP synthase (glutamine-hydrolysing)
VPAVTGRYVRVTVAGVIYQIYREALEAGQDVLCMHTAGADTTRLVSAGSSRACAEVTIGRQDRDEPATNILAANQLGFSLIAAAVQLHQPDAHCTPLNIADGEALPYGITLSDFDGVMFPGSPLHIYDSDPCVTRQIDFARTAFAAGVPVWGSCWGLQLAVVALGGSVRRNPRGRELPIARAITVTDTGRAHPLLASRPAVFDALCSHLDEIETLPPNSQVLAANEVSAVQAIAAQTSGRGSFHGTQYHPEHTFAVSAALVEMRAAELVDEGLGASLSEIVAIAVDYRAFAQSRSDGASTDLSRVFLGAGRSAGAGALGASSARDDAGVRHKEFDRGGTRPRRDRQ